MTTYTIEPERSTLHGTFSREYPPILTIDPGDTVRYRTLDAGWQLRPFATQELVDLRITQIVNAGILGVHAVLPHNALLPIPD